MRLQTMQIKAEVASVEPETTEVHFPEIVEATSSEIPEITGPKEEPELAEVHFPETAEATSAAAKPAEITELKREPEIASV